VNVRLFVKLIVRSCPVGTVITTGDQVSGVVTVNAAGFNGPQVAVPPVGLPQVYPHIGTAVPSGIVAVAGPAVRFTVCWAADTPTPRRRIHTAMTAVFKVLR
jgi:hypothetical protein